ncbi:MAG: ACT domain-containing protein [bacterium]|nr:ACT domain-containing protein [bacterium]
MEIKRFEQKFSVCKVTNYSQVNLEDQFCFIGKTEEELSLVCLTENVPDNTTEREDGWRAMRIQGELDFSLIGILSKISTILAENKIGIFAISTYNTDYILVKEEKYEQALAALEDAGYTIVK